MHCVLAQACEHYSFYAQNAIQSIHMLAAAAGDNYAAPAIILHLLIQYVCIPLHWY